MSVLAAIAVLASLHFFLKLIHLLFKPSSLRHTIFARDEAKQTNAILYITFIFYNVLFALHKWGIIHVNVE